MMNMAWHYIRLCSVVAMKHTLSKNLILGYLYCNIDKKKNFMLHYYWLIAGFRVKTGFFSIRKDALAGLENEKKNLF